MTNSGSVVLAIESAINGGSISLLQNGCEIANWIGSSNISKAEDLLVSIDELLTTANISRHDIDLIAVSAGPGSFTGIRIGLATALGLKAGLGIEMSSESAIKAMIYVLELDGEFVAAVPVGRNSVCVQPFTKSGREVDPMGPPHSLADDAFIEYVGNNKNKQLILHASLYERCEPSPTTTNFGLNIAYAIGRICSQYPDHLTEPLFISKSF